MRRRFLPLLVPVIAVSLAAPSIAAAASGSTPLAGKRAAVTSSKSEIVMKPTGRRWN
jgi:hypothetical protein